MSNRKYPDAVIKELQRLSVLSRKRTVVNRLSSIAGIIDQWKNKSLSEEAALQEIARLVEIREEPWAEGSDIGIPIANALTDGTLFRSDFSDKTWKSIELLVDLLNL